MAWVGVVLWRSDACVSWDDTRCLTHHGEHMIHPFLESGLERAGAAAAVEHDEHVLSCPHSANAHGEAYLRDLVLAHSPPRCQLLVRVERQGLGTRLGLERRARLVARDVPIRTRTEEHEVETTQGRELAVVLAVVAVVV